MTFRTILISLICILVFSCKEKNEPLICDIPPAIQVQITAVQDSYDAEYECDVLKILTAKDVTNGESIDLTFGIADVAYILLRDGVSYSVSDGIYYITGMLVDMNSREDQKYLYFEINTQTTRSVNQVSGCGTDASSKPQPFDPMLSRASADNWIGVNCYIHVLRKTSHEGLDLETVNNTLINRLNRHYTHAKIQFELVGSEYLDILTDDWIQRLTLKGDVYDLIKYNPHSNAIDIYVLSFCEDKDDSGIAPDVLSSSCVISWPTMTYGTLTHEIGHCLGLYHTHHGTSDQEPGIKELVNGSNGDVAGDYIRDTPADPGLWAGGVIYDGGDLRDANGDKYNPDRTNFMSYCLFMQEKFSPIQILKMHDALLTNPTLKRVVSGYSLDQNVHFNKQVELKINGVLPPDNVDWVINRYTSTNSPAAIENYYGQSAVILSSSKSEYFIVNAFVTKEDGTIETLTSELSSNEPSTTIGTLAWSVGLNGYSGGTNEFSYGSTLPVSNDLTLSLEYLDPANAILNGLSYRCVTATKRVLNGSNMRITKSDCADGFLKIRVSDNCGLSDGYFTILTQVSGGYYSLSFNDNGGMTINGKFGASKSDVQKAPGKAPGITGITIYDKDGRMVYNTECDMTTELSIPTDGWKPGEYQAVIKDGNKEEIVYFGV